MIKAYTDLGQSKRLAEILPLDSADMEYILEQWIDEKTGRHKEGYDEIPVVKVEDDCPLQPITHPCWSLAALFDTLPKTIGDYSKMMGYFDDAYHCDYLDEDGEGIGLCTTADNLVDAVYEMVLIQNKPK